ncbi:MAG: alpha-hydroxy-acid oxidizing protein [Pseudomonadota bacterium]
MSEGRKEDHVRICLGSGVEGPHSTGLARVTLQRSPVPVSMDLVDPGVELLGYRLGLPLMIASMSGGWSLGRKLNQELAALAERWRIGFAVGSMRPALDDPGRAADYDVKPLAPSVPVLGNLGVWQLRDRDAARRYLALCEGLGFDGVMVHVNPAHELAQPEGERDLGGAFDALREFASGSALPVIVKEVGHGFSAETLDDLADLPIHGLDVAGAGGTNWPLVEAARCPAGSTAERRALELAREGRDTLSTLLDAVPRFRGRVLIAGGGIRSAEDIAKVLGLGADLASFAAPILRRVCFEDGEGQLTVDGTRADPWVETLAQDLRTLLAAAGARTVNDMREGARVVVHA